MKDNNIVKELSVKVESMKDGPMKDAILKDLEKKKNIVSK